VERNLSKPISISIAAVERDTGISKDTLRVWERRYGFPQPARDDYDERSYPLDQVEKLRLMDVGHRPGKIVHLPLEDLQRLGEGLASAPERMSTDGDVQDLRIYIDLIKSHEVDELRRALSQALLRHGLGHFVVDVVAPLNQMVGDAWMRGYFEIFEEHLYTESIQVVLRNAINTLPKPQRGQGPKVLLTTFPQEPHGLGLLMVEAMFALEGCQCISLGTQTPIYDIALAAESQKVDIIALSFTACVNPNHVVDGLSELRAKVPQHMHVWAGGSCPILYRKPVAGVVPVAELMQIRESLQQWQRNRTAL
jgi:MerR family transcriptional regulator, light-induced transcriptional regulator